MKVLYYVLMMEDIFNMIDLTEEELNWGIDCLKVTKFDIEHINNNFDVFQVDHLKHLSKNIYENIKYILNNIEKINTHEESNKTYIDILDEICGFWYWQEWDTREEVKTYIDDDIFLNYIGKIYEIWEYENNEDEEEYSLI